jgi:hypothetical protein
MSNIGTCRNEIAADLHLLVDDTTINRAICKAARFQRDTRRYFSERTFSFALTQGTSSYAPGNGPPLDLVEIVGPVLYLLVNGSEDDKRQVWRVTSREYDARTVGGTSQSEPTIFDFWAGKLRLYPTPDSTSYLLTGRYVRDLGVPEVRYEGGSFKFYAPPDGVRQMSTDELDAYTSDWFDYVGAYHQTRTRAAYTLAKEVMRDADLANDYLTQWLEQVASLDVETEQRTGGMTEILGTILGDGVSAWGE